MRNKVRLRVGILERKQLVTKKGGREKSVRVRNENIDEDTTEMDEDAIREKCDYVYNDYSTNYAAEAKIFYDEWCYRYHNVPNMLDYDW